MLRASGLDVSASKLTMRASVAAHYSFYSFLPSFYYQTEHRNPYSSFLLKARALRLQWGPTACGSAEKLFPAQEAYVLIPELNA
jgi:hypothetical protein